jgi:hypothetical protein
MTDDFVYIVAVILLPLIPAVIIFKLIPGESRVDAEGPFQGLKLKLSGAFAGYFIVVLVAWAQVRLMIEPSRVRIWHVTGSVSLGEPGAGPITAVQVQVEPPRSSIKDGQGRISFPLAIPLKHSGDGISSLYLSFPGYETAYLELDPDGKHLAAYQSDSQKAVHIDDANSVIDVGTIVLRKATRPSP